MLITVFYSCKALKSHTDVTKTHFVFEHCLLVSAEGEKSINELVKNNNAARMFIEQIKNTPKTKIFVDVQRDTIWRYTTENEKVIGDIFSLSKSNGNLNYHPQKQISLIYRTFRLFPSNDEYIVEKEITNKKQILGFDCYYVKITKLDNAASDTGNTIYEMYVTDKINLPVHALINITKNFDEFFPLEIKIWEEHLRGTIEVYQVSEIR